MSPLFDLTPEPPPGFRFEVEVISPEEEARLVSAIRTLEFRPVVFRGVESRRRIVQFGHYYSFQSRAITPTTPLPDYLIDLRARVAPLATLPAEEFTEALVTEYAPGATIGQHRDAPPFGIVVGVSLAGRCTLKLQPPAASSHKPLSIELPPRSAYVFSGEVRRDWLHSIPPTKALRYSVTYRTVVASARTKDGLKA